MSASFAKLQVLGLGNPLLDIIVPNVSTVFLEKYKLKLNNAILEDEVIHAELYNDIEETFKETNYAPGGSTQNSIRICQALYNLQFGNKKANGLTGFFGAVGANDKHAILMKQLAIEEGVQVEYAMSQKNSPTGTCAVLVHGGERALCTRLGASSEYTLENLNVSESWNLLEQSKIVYSAGFFLTASSEVMLEVGKHCCEANKSFGTNLSALFLIEFFKEPMLKVLYYADLIFGNETEISHFGAIHGCESTDLVEIGRHIALLTRANVQKPRNVFITCGSNPTIVVTHEVDGTINVQKFSVRPLSSNLLVDTNGAGDAFVGGILFGLSQNFSLEKATMLAHAASRHVIQRSGCTFEFTSDPELNSLL